MPARCSKQQKRDHSSNKVSETLAGLSRGELVNSVNQRSIHSVLILLLTTANDSKSS